MSRTRIVKGNITEITKGTSRIFGKSIQINSSGRIEYFAQNYTYGDPQSPPLKVMDGAVKEIELLTALDKGSANDKSGTYQDGMIFGKSYHFKVKSYFQNPPANITDIKWMIKYHSPSQSKWIEIPLSAKGDSVTITMNDEDMCGRFIYVRAYVYSAEKEAEYKQWKHNRFRWFDRMTIHEQISERLKEPWRVKQGYSSLCGMAALYYSIVKNNSSVYEKLSIELFRTGFYTIGSYIIKPHDKALEMYDVNPTDSNFISMKMFEIDWIVLATTRSKESLNSQFVYKGFENGDMDMLKAVNWPNMLTRMCKELGGFKNVIAHNLSLSDINNRKRVLSGRIHDYFSDSDLKELLDIDKSYRSGNTILIMIDSSMIEDVSGYNSLIDIANDSHWIVYEGGLTFFDIKGNITIRMEDVDKLTFRIFTWGRNPTNAVYKDFTLKKDIIDTQVLKFITPNGINVKSFKSNYYGYIEVS